MSKSKNHNVILVGAQWGDEGKGKIIDLLAQKSDYIVRYQGGNNAGHTVCFDDEKKVDIGVRVAVEERLGAGNRD